MHLTPKSWVASQVGSRIPRAIFPNTSWTALCHHLHQINCLHCITTEHPAYSDLPCKLAVLHPEWIHQSAETLGASSVGSSKVNPGGRPKSGYASRPTSQCPTPNPLRVSHHASHRPTTSFVAFFVILVAFYPILTSATPITINPQLAQLILLGTAHTSAVTGAVAIPVCRLADNISPGFVISAYAVWSTAFCAIFTLEMLSWREWHRQRLFVSLVIISGFHLLGILAANLSAVDGLTIWGPLALTLSIYLIPAVLDAKMDTGGKVGATQGELDGVGKELPLP